MYAHGQALKETQTLDELLQAGSASGLWHSQTTADSTILWATFAHSPNDGNTEINVRQSVFYPSKPNIDYIHVKGFHLSQAATPWAPPTAEQIGLLGVHWSKGWVIEDNEVSHSKCVGITLGKYGDELDNKSESVEGYVMTIKRAIANHWDKKHIGSHIMRRNHVHGCGQAGIAGRLAMCASRCGLPNSRPGASSLPKDSISHENVLF